jgi:hypothetical protein
VKVIIDNISTITETLQHLGGAGDEKPEPICLEINFTVYLDSDIKLNGNISVDYEVSKHMSMKDHEEGIKECILNNIRR